MRFKELLEDLKRSFGSDAVKGRVSDLCKPSSRKYDTAVSITLGRNIDSIVVDTHATGVQCMNVSLSVWKPSGWAYQLTSPSRRNWPSTRMPTARWPSRKCSSKSEIRASR